MGLKMPIHKIQLQGFTSSHGKPAESATLELETVPEGITSRGGCILKVTIGDKSLTIESHLLQRSLHALDPIKNEIYVLHS